MKYSIIIVLLFLANVASSQIVVGVENAASKNTLIKLEDYLLSIDAPSYDMATTREDTMGNVTAFYERIVRQFFDTSKMDKRIRQMEKIKAVDYNGLKNSQYSVLSEMAVTLRCISHDSICVLGWNEYKKITQIEDTVYNKNTVFIGSVTDSSWNNYYYIEFDDAGKKIILIGWTLVRDREMPKPRKAIRKRYSPAREKNKKKPG
jgi:hypothetical protein